MINPSPQSPPLLSTPRRSYTAFARKASLNQLTSNSLDRRDEPLDMPPITPTSRNGSTSSELEIGDLVDVPGGMYGTVKFVGSVKGKNGVFAGVELSKEWAQRGKNDGDVDGVRYFTTSVPKAGIFLPINRASKRSSASSSGSSNPRTPKPSSSADFPTAQTPPTPIIPKFSQSVGPLRPGTPQYFKQKARPSLPRPESPLRRQIQVPSTTQERPSISGLGSRSVIGSSARYAPSPKPGANNEAQARKKTPFTPRSTSALGSYDAFDEEPAPIGIARTINGNRATTQIEELQKLKAELAAKDGLLKEQAGSLAEMENNLAELQMIMAANGSEASGKGGPGTHPTDAELRAQLREKNEKISMLTAEFDAHRADFRSTIDTLELASTETERVYEQRVTDLQMEVNELQARSEDVESVAQQLKHLEELVQELEEGLEDARRGEAEARGEVEFLRGEVERGRSELRREREKAAAALKGIGTAAEEMASIEGVKEVEQRDDEIRGLKAIIHSLSRDAVPDLASPQAERRLSTQRNGNLTASKVSNQRESAEFSDERIAKERLERENRELQGIVERKAFREEELEREIERLRKGANFRASAGTLGSNNTLTQSKRSSARDSKGTVVSWRERDHSPDGHRRNATLESMPEIDSTTYSSDADGSVLWCEICETGGHDILTCTNMFGSQAAAAGGKTGAPAVVPPGGAGKRTGKDVVMEGLKVLSPAEKPAPLSPSRRTSPLSPRPNPMEAGMVPGKKSAAIDPAKWCALCERDGHESIDCPFEDGF
ncbi:MAG: hypothetical protein M1829_006305 [Trizodia sp. TS-e1964]|nr:MAG: hypothetical protein M1829_006305 [Trizodia sp. TS-e1964]